MSRSEKIFTSGTANTSGASEMNMTGKAATVSRAAIGDRPLVHSNVG
jgi:hypothetical protein